MSDVKKYLRAGTPLEMNKSVKRTLPNNTGRITEHQERPVRERKPPEYLKDYEVYGRC